MLTEAKQDNLKELIKEGVCVVDFYSETCGPCKALAPILNRLESELPFITVVKVNTTAYPNYAEEYEIQAVPTLLFYKDGMLCERHLGLLNGDRLKEKIGQYLYD